MQIYTACYFKPYPCFINLIINPVQVFVEVTIGR